ncbi:Vesicle-associated membrane protein 713 [Vitis vinifera]|uniref:Vesicle-associated membrane protein 713 n=1 Tax=Vitis vinifera TaxID=29760 RepID=A0A438CW94_VITVI|nr:Vesicle-associated membrane protein 713 [Vitis vinifera]
MPIIANNMTEGRIPFAFLEDIHQRFVKTYGRAIHPAPAYAMNDEFSRVLSQQMDHYSNDPNADRLNRSKDEMRVTASLELLVDKTATLQEIQSASESRLAVSKILFDGEMVAMVLIIYRVLAFFCRDLLLPSCLK